jgi:hypothetical protein
MRTLFGFPGDGGGKVDHLVLALGLIRCTCREEDKWAAHTWVSQSDIPGIVEVSGTHYVTVMAKMPPPTPATEWMTESLVIVVWAYDVVQMKCSH